ncbi:hypothetical protein DF3PA_200059 [Candidatus Defluviicoccus seviourii]|uniref:Uncharacterized protein n=1 Tax=Candidatus Defluviicoccus seviourii TaxID=2565273 RepID=A0A564WCZ3_9PROT|nr:hypothetical protein DF3PA_200059 [Candidatus Defluviicoccus seviourii]
MVLVGRLATGVLPPPANRMIETLGVAGKTGRRARLLVITMGRSIHRLAAVPTDRCAARAKNFLRLGLLRLSCP